MKRAAVTAVGALALAAGGCSTVDLGDPPADVNACRPSQSFFVDHVWPEFLNQSHNGKLCKDSGCHDRASGRLLVLLDVPAEPPSLPLDPTSAWGQNYRSASQQMICTNVRGSELFTRPGGLVTHGAAGALIDPVSGPEGPLLDMWVTAQP